jgi:hypothetical protein
MNANGAQGASSNSLRGVAEAIVRARLARDPDRLERMLAEAEAAAWCEITAVFKDAVKAAIVQQMQDAGCFMPLSSVEDATHGLVCISSDAMAERARDEQPTVAQIANPPAKDVAAEDASSLPVDPGNDAHGIYVYGVIERGAASLPQMDGMADGASVRLHECNRLAAVVSDVPLSQFGQQALEANLCDLGWLEQSVRRHQAVLDQVRSLTTLAPMKFATIYADVSRLDVWLAEQQAALLRLLAYLRDRQEWGMKVYVDRATLAERLAAHSETLKDLRAQIAGKSEGAVYFLARRLEELTAEEVERVCFSLADEVHRTLAQQSVAACLNALPSEDNEHNVQMVLNAAYLVADDQAAGFQAAVEALAEEHGAKGVHLQVSGPWPAYNFVATVHGVEEGLHYG